MTSKFKNITFLTLTLALLFIPALATAHAGIMDRWIEQMVDCSAFAAIVGVTQIVLAVLSFGFLKGTVLHKNLIKHSRRIAINRKWWLYLLVICMTSFVVAPYMGYLLKRWLFFFIVPLLIVSFINLILVLIPKTRKFYLRGRSIYIMVLLSLHQIIGWVVYLVVYRIDFVKNLFAYTDDEYQIFNYYVYPGLHGFEHTAGVFASLLIYFSFPYVILLVITGCRKLLNIICSK